MKKNVWRAVIEVGFIIFLFFLFYSNLLMGEFERSGMGQKRGVTWAIGDVFTTPILQLQWLPRSSVIAFLNFFERDSSSWWSNSVRDVGAKGTCRPPGDETPRFPLAAPRVSDAVGISFSSQRQIQ
jgi:hypothetical protein